MTDRAAVRRWVDGYLQVWSTNDPDDLAALFTEDARYWTLPTRPPIGGRDAIIRDWLDRADQPGTCAWRFGTQGEVGRTCRRGRLSGA